MPLLAPEALGLGDGDAADPDLVQRLLHLVELERLDNRLDLLHASDPLRTVRPGSRSKPDQARLSGSAGRVGAVSRHLAPIKSRANWRIAGFRGDSRRGKTDVPQPQAAASFRCLKYRH